jgi:hypothetical protein
VAYLALAAFVIVVIGLTIASRRAGTQVTGCCASADPSDDLRMRQAERDPDQHSS